MNRNFRRQNRIPNLPLPPRGRGRALRPRQNPRRPFIIYNVPQQQPRPLSRNPRPRRRRNKKNGISKNTPLFQGITSVRGEPIRQLGPNTYHVEYVASAENFCTDQMYMVLPIHPLFMNKRILNMAIGWTNYDIRNIVLSTNPLVATTDATPVAFAYTRNCVPIDYNTTSDTAYTALINSGISGIAHTPLTYAIPNVKKIMRPMIPVVPSDIVCTIYGANKQSGTTVLENSVLVTISCDIEFANPYTGDEMPADQPEQDTFTTNSAGVRCTSALAAGFGFIVNSTVSLADTGELFIFPKFSAATTDYDMVVSHNLSPMYPKLNTTDRGDIIVLNYELN
jgi:hypothetical protein